MAKIYNDFQSANLMSFAKSFARLNGQPLDKSEIWYDLAEAKEYAATDAAYVGQILAVINSDNNEVVFYGIQDAAGTLKEVGSTPLGDNFSIEIVDGAIQLKNFGTKYYAYVPAVKDEETGEITEASKYVLTEGFKAGLEPRVVLEGTDLVLAWYEPGSETVEDIAANVESVSKTVDELDETLNAEGGLVDQVDDLKEQVGTAADETGNAATGLYAEIERIDNELATKANADEVYTKEETDEAIAEAIAGVDHLKREVVDVLPNVDEADSNTIYMVPSGLQEDDNKYYEWILLNGVFEQVGSWEVDLSNYATKNEVTAVDTKVNTLTQTVTDNKSEAEEAITNLQDQLDDEIARAQAAEKANADAIVKKADKGTTLAEYGIIDTYTKDEITDLIADITGGESAADVKAELNAYKTTTNATLADMQKDLEALEGAEPNYISSVDENNFTVTEGKLELNSAAGRLITDDEVKIIEQVSNGDFENFVKSVDETELNVNESGKLSIIGLPASKVTDLASLLNAKADKAAVEAIDIRVTNIEDILTWKDM